MTDPIAHLATLWLGSVFAFRFMLRDEQLRWIVPLVFLALVQITVLIAYCVMLGRMSGLP